MAEPTPSPTDARQVRTRKNLLEALLRLLETRPFDQVTIREIAAEAGIGYATFFRHHPSKEALLHELAAGQIGELLARALPVFAARDTRQACVALFDYVAAHRALWTALLTGGAAATLKQEFTDQARSIAAAEGGGGGLIPDDLRATVSVSATVEVMAWWLQQGTDLPVDRMADILDQLVVRPAIAGSEYAR